MFVFSLLFQRVEGREEMAEKEKISRGYERHPLVASLNSWGVGGATEGRQGEKATQVPVLDPRK